MKKKKKEVVEARRKRRAEYIKEFKVSKYEKKKRWCQTNQFDPLSDPDYKPWKENPDEQENERSD